MRYPLSILLSALLLASCTQAHSRLPEPEQDFQGIPLRKMLVERLPDLNTPRVMHAVCEVNGELVVFGGSTTGFTSTRTAEYFAMGQWHQIPMLYNHPVGFATDLASGDIILGGGCSEDFGIGQSWGVERYIPSKHRFEWLPILDRKRACPNAAELPDGSVVVSGNWYSEDAIGLCVPDGLFESVKPSAAQRSFPYILPTAPDNAIIFASQDPHGDPCDRVIDRLRGDAFTVPLFEEYRPLPLPSGFFSPAQYSIGDPDAGDYSYLIPVLRDSTEVRIALLRGEEFSLLETNFPIPTPAELRLSSFSPAYAFFVDHADRRAWLYLADLPCCSFVRIDYGPALEGGKASLTVYRSEPLDSGLMVACLLSDGRFLLAGGGPPGKEMNFLPVKAAALLTPEDMAPVSGLSGWRIALLALLGAGILGLLVSTTLRHRKAAADAQESAAEKAERELIDKIAALMEKEQLFRRQSLKILDVAQRLGTNVTYISSCINNVHGGTFNDFVNRYRVRYAQQWLLDHPDKKVTEAVEESGFSSEASFFRNFKTLTGQAPSEWLAAQKENGTAS